MSYVCCLSSPLKAKPKPRPRDLREWRPETVGLHPGHHTLRALPDAAGEFGQRGTAGALRDALQRVRVLQRSAGGGTTL